MKKERDDRRKQEDAVAKLHGNYGSVPKYINRYNRQRHEAMIEKAIEEERAKLPPGTRLMPEEER